ncbi:hypothetical protein OBBRIDRAFT_830592 [Obba rivulosa]|uniref:C2H2-type domain-containing protein n=1 Tax=Obba rivulosa TaxID=1052685 RepID=A0A8E2DUC8_9APHY|nr:hypothetical protein OBBRIDRAFT_830592 [Obba rivulosa]
MSVFALSWSTPSTGAKPYKCGWWPVCKRAFGDKSTCSRHEFTKHLGLVGHKCPVKSCTSSIKRPTDFARHLREKHCIDPKGLDITQFAVYKPGGGPVKKRRKCRSVVSSPDNSLLSCPLDDFTEAGSTSSSSVTPLPETPEMSVQPELLPIELPQIESQPSFVSQQHGLQIGDFFFPDSFEKFDFAPQPQLTITPIVPQAESAQSYPSAGDSLAFDFVSCIDPALMDNAYGGQSQQYFAYPAYLGYHTSFH